MIADSLKNYKRYSSLHKDWDEAFSLINDWLSKPIPEGSSEVKAGNIKLVLQHYETKSFDAKKFECHRKDIDIQFLVKGKETIYYADGNGLKVVVPYNEEVDRLNFEDSPAASPINLVEKTFAVFFPGEGHKTQIKWGESAEAIKIIVKLPV